MHLFIIYYLLLFITSTQQDESVLRFDPSSLSLFLDDSQAVDVELLKTDVVFPIFISFLYDDKLDNVEKYIKTIPNITFSNDTTEQNPKRTIFVNASREGHLVLSARSNEIHISSILDYIRIDIGRSKIVDIFTQIVGWIYFAAWSISFYPQIILNFRRRSVIGLNFDFLALNIIGHSCYSVFNLSLYISTSVQNQYYERHPHGVLPVLLNDVIFSVHAVFACLVTILQCIFFERGTQRVSYIARPIAGVMLLFLLISSIVSLSGPLSKLDLIYYFSYVKLAITIIKYCPQAWMNYKRKSTEGWSIGNILLDLTGGILSLVQMFMLARNYDDWTSIFGSPTKLGLGLFSIFFDLIFVVQHYWLYRNHESGRLIIPGKIIDADSSI